MLILDPICSGNFEIRLNGMNNVSHTYVIDECHKDGIVHQLLIKPNNTNLYVIETCKYDYKFYLSSYNNFIISHCKS